MTGKLIRAADLFCGAGGTSTGMLKAIRELKFTADLLAINHWDVAIATHTANHEEIRHLCQNLDKVDPNELIPSGRLDLLVASPECKHHSNARGGKPRSDQKRADAWLLMRWVEKLFVKNILIENVREFIDWGPLGATGQPLKKYKGTYFQQFIATLKINYHVEYKILNCADYGDPTTRERFFLMARRKGFPHFAWPLQSHASPAVITKQKDQPALFISRRRLKPWVPAREIIDWTLPGKSIFARKRPLSVNTIARIIAGMRKYSGIEFVMATGGGEGQMNPRAVDETLRTVMPNTRLNVFEPCLINMKGKSIGRSIDGPTFTQTGQPHQYLLEPVLLNLKNKAGRSRSVEKPTFTQCAGGNHQGLIESELTPFIAATNHGGGKDGERRHHAIDKTFPTVTQVDAWALIEASLIQYFEDVRDKKVTPIESIDDLPLEAESFLLKSYTGSDSAPLNKPCPSVTANFEHLGLVENFIMKLSHTKSKGDYTYPMTRPLTVVTGLQEHALVQPYLIKFNGTGKAHSIDSTLDTITGKDRFGLVIPQLGAILDIRFRMLQPHELAAAMSFPKNYSFSGTREDKVMQIGNAVPVRTAKALCKALLTSGVAKAKPTRKARTLKKAA